MSDGYRELVLTLQNIMYNDSELKYITKERNIIHFIIERICNSNLRDITDEAIYKNCILIRKGTVDYLESLGYNLFRQFETSHDETYYNRPFLRKSGDKTCRLYNLLTTLDYSLEIYCYATPPPTSRRRYPVMSSTIYVNNIQNFSESTEDDYLAINLNGLEHIPGVSRPVPVTPRSSSGYTNELIWGSTSRLPTALGEPINNAFWNNISSEEHSSDSDGVSEPGGIFVKLATLNSTGNRTSSTSGGPTPNDCDDGMRNSPNLMEVENHESSYPGISGKGTSPRKNDNLLLSGESTVPRRNDNPGMSNESTVPWRKDNPGMSSEGTVPWRNDNPGMSSEGTVPWMNDNPGMSNESAVPRRNDNPGMSNESVVPRRNDNPGMSNQITVSRRNDKPGISSKGTVPWRNDNPGMSNECTVPRLNDKPGMSSKGTVHRRNDNPGMSNEITVSRMNDNPGMSSEATVPRRNNNLGTSMKQINLNKRTASSSIESSSNSFLCLKEPKQSKLSYDAIEFSPIYSTHFPLQPSTIGNIRHSVNNLEPRESTIEKVENVSFNECTEVKCFSPSAFQSTDTDQEMLINHSNIKKHNNEKDTNINKPSSSDKSSQTMYSEDQLEQNVSCIEMNTNSSNNHNHTSIEHSDRMEVFELESPRNFSDDSQQPLLIGIQQNEESYNQLKSFDIFQSSREPYENRSLLDQTGIEINSGPSHYFYDGILRYNRTTNNQDSIPDRILDQSETNDVIDIDEDPPSDNSPDIESDESFNFDTSENTALSLARIQRQVSYHTFLERNRITESLQYPEQLREAPQSTLNPRKHAFMPSMNLPLVWSRKCEDLQYLLSLKLSHPLHYIHEYNRIRKSKMNILNCLRNRESSGALSQTRVMEAVAEPHYNIYPPADEEDIRTMLAGVQDEEEMDLYGYLMVSVTTRRTFYNFPVNQSGKIQFW